LKSTSELWVRMVTTAHDRILQRRDAQRSLQTVGLRDVDSPRGLSPVGAPMHPPVQIGQPILQTVYDRRTAFCLRGPVSVAGYPRRSGGLPVLGPVASRRAEGLRLRRAAGPLASHADRRGAFPLRGVGSAL
jgi:hypothetical protein